MHHLIRLLLVLEQASRPAPTCLGAGVDACSIRGRRLFVPKLPIRAGLALVALLFMAGPSACEPAQADSDKEQPSWIAKPQTPPQTGAIFTDCRGQAMPERGIPIGGKMRPMQMSKMMEGEAAMLAAPPEAAPDEGPPPSPDAPPAPAPDKSEGQSVYLSNDDSMSLSSAQRIEYAIDNFLPVPQSHLRPHEFLNYYRFAGVDPEPGRAFGVKAEMTPGVQRGQTTLALSVRGRTIGKDQRRPVALTFVLDQSGSMSAANKMTYLKRGMKRVYDELKAGDVVNVVQFNHAVCTPLENFVVGRDAREIFDRAVDYLEPVGSTNLHDGLVRGYELANKYFQADRNNRVLMITDAMANTGIVDEPLTSTVTMHYDKNKIAFSGVGVGRDFNDSLLNRLTERGKGAYLFLANENAVDRVFGDKFVSLLEVVARDVHFKLTLPKSLTLETFYGEEASEKKEEVQAIHYFANSAQLFLSDLKGEPAAGDEIKLDVEYTDPPSGQPKTEHFAWTAGTITQSPSRMIDKARLTMLFTDLLGETGPATWPTWPCFVYPCYRLMLPPPLPRPGERIDDERAAKTCAHYQTKMEELAKSLADDPEVKHLLGLREKYCDRFARKTPATP
ncbi:MAG: VWA domain-containing protein [Myxococcales bacterium]|nr:MAG: VWA domain-containing protein [Myxococcales bacterium]